MHGIKDIASNFVAAKHSLLAARVFLCYAFFPSHLSLYHYLFPVFTSSLQFFSLSLHLSPSVIIDVYTLACRISYIGNSCIYSSFFLSSLSLSLSLISPLPLLLIPWVIGCLLGLAYKPRLLKIANTFDNVARTLAGQSFLIAVYAYEWSCLAFNLANKQKNKNKQVNAAKVDKQKRERKKKKRR